MSVIYLRCFGLHKRGNCLKRQTQKYFVGFSLLMPFLIASFYNACARIGTGYVSTDEDAAFVMSLCSNSLLSVYEKSYFPFLSTSCSSCHGTSHGSIDLNTSYQAFMTKGVQLINTKGADGHNGLSSSFVQSKINEIKPSWDAGYKEYQTCQQTNQPVDNGQFSLKLAPKKVNLNTSTFIKVSWNLSVDVQAGETPHPVTLEIEMRYLMNQGQTVGIEFKNPKIRLNAGALAPYEVKKISIYLDNQFQESVTLFQNAYAYTNDSVTLKPMVNTAVSAVDYYPSVSANTEVSMVLGRVSTEILGGIDGYGATIDPGGVIPIPSFVRFTDLQLSTDKVGVFNNRCNGCHGGSNPSAGLDLTNYNQAISKTTAIIKRMSDTQKPMPPSGVLGDYERGVVQKWYSLGMPN